MNNSCWLTFFFHPDFYLRNQLYLVTYLLFRWYRTQQTKKNRSERKRTATETFSFSLALFPQFLNSFYIARPFSNNLQQPKRFKAFGNDVTIDITTAARAFLFSCARLILDDKKPQASHPIFVRWPVL